MTPSQADRDAAADWCEAQPFPSKQAEAPMIRAGEYDHHSLVQAFAVHRRAALEEAAMVVEEELENRRAEQKRDLFDLFDNFTRGQINTALRLHQAIRALIDKEPT